MPTFRVYTAMDLLQLINHVVQKSPHWRANDTLGHVKESHQTSRDCSAAKGLLARLLHEGCAVKHVTQAIFSVVKGLVSNARVT